MSDATRELGRLHDQLRLACHAAEVAIKSAAVGRGEDACAALERVRDRMDEVRAWLRVMFPLVLDAPPDPEEGDREWQTRR